MQVSLKLPIRALPWRAVFLGKQTWRQVFREYLIYATLVSPAIVILWTYVFDADDFRFSSLISLIVSEGTLLVCHWGVFLLLAAERANYVARGLTPPERSIGAHVLRSSLFLLPGMYVGFAAVSWLSRVYGFQWRPPGLDHYKRGGLIGIFNMGLILAIYLWHESKQLKKNAEAVRRDLESRTLKAQIAALSAQMNPHLLFNSLNSIAAMIQTAPTQAEDMTVELSSLYRRVLDASKKERHSLASELDLCRSYLEIEKSRFRERIQFEIKIDPSVNLSTIDLPVLCLQPLVENAVKHGLLPSSAGGRVTLHIGERSTGMHILISDNGVGRSKSPASKGSGTGLANCEARLKLAFGEEASLMVSDVSPHGTEVEIILPAPGGAP